MSIDTNAYTAIRRGDAQVFSVLEEADQITMTVIVLGELRAGFASSNREAKNVRELEEFLEEPYISITPIDSETAVHYARIDASLRKVGKAIPTNDQWIAALALQHHHALLTFDAHVQRVEGLTCGVTLESLGI
ncbi:MAG: type II toxin-antitoxin system VapC family toxin [Pleurocapsa sp. SU_196_0]|nr:type II toxin-antitoxin system VapC family toxin [Pleurocapsa sp. SU_196_0]